MAEPNLEMPKPFIEVAEPTMAEPTMAEPTVAEPIPEVVDPPLVRSTASSSSTHEIVCGIPAALGPLAKAFAGRKGKNIVKRRAKKAPSVDPLAEDFDHRTFMFNTRKSLYEDGPGSANLFSIIKHLDVSFPPLDVLVNSNDYAHMAQFGMKKDKLEESEALSAAKIRDLEEANACFEIDQTQIAKSAAQQAEELAVVRSELEGERAKCEKKMKRAFKERRQVLAEKYRVRLENARASLENLGKAKTDELYLVQAEANIQLIEVL